MLTIPKAGMITTNNKHFRPEADITRAEAIAMMLSAVKLMPKSDDTKPWQETVMNTSKTLGILADDKLAADEKITRGELFYTVSKIIKVLYKQEIDYIFDVEDDLYTGLWLFAKKVAHAVKKSRDADATHDKVTALFTIHP